MSLGEQFVQELMQLGGAELPFTLEVNNGRPSISARLSQWSPLAVGLEAIEVSARPFSGPLSEVASQLAQRLNYLNEPIRVFEFDSQSCEAQLRSDPPKTISDGVEYFELRLARDGVISLRRYRNTAEGPRLATTFTMTLETLSRVINDLAAA